MATKTKTKANTKGWKPSPNTNPIVSTRLPKVDVDALDKIAKDMTAANPLDRPRDKGYVVRVAVLTFIKSYRYQASTPTVDAPVLGADAAKPKRSHKAKPPAAE